MKYYLANNLYGGTYQLFNYTFPELGRKVNFVESTDLKAIENGITDKTKAIFAESIGNPKLDVPDYAGIAEIAHEAEIPFVVDNTHRCRSGKTNRTWSRHNSIISN